LDGEVAETPQPDRSTGIDFPERVPILLDPARDVTLRPHQPGDIDDLVEQSNDPEMIRWTTVPTPSHGYGRAEAAEYLDIIATGWRDGTTMSWAIEAPRDGARRYCGGVDLRLRENNSAEVGFGLHPGARGHSVMSTAVRLARDYAFDVVGLDVLRWRAMVGNWGSRRVAAAAGFTFDGTIRRLLPHRGELVDAWVATITRDDPRTPQPGLTVPRLAGRTVVLREFTEADLDRVVEACADPRTRHWLVSLPEPYTRADALDYLTGVREQAAQRTGLTWCVADPTDDRCLGSVSLEGLGGYARRPEIGYWAHPEARGRGVVTAAVRLVTEHAEEQHLADSILIRCALGNQASRHVAQQAGYAQVGVLPNCEPLGDGELADLVLYSRP
jgi:ribosomal-protein-alanine N-acetyltransferase